MKLTKEDYMRLPKERLAELLVELNNPVITLPPESPSIPIMPTKPSGWGCDGTICTNPQMDCINCPRTLHYDVYVNKTDSVGTTITDDKK